MHHTTTHSAEYRYGNYGPGYLLRGPRTDIGVVQLRPGDEAANHYHTNIEETFVGLEGEATLWIDCEQSFTFTAGDIYQCLPAEMHYFRNESDTTFKALFIKAPYDPEDGVQRPWRPGEAIPDK